MVKVKICGLTRVDDAIAACEWRADVIGLNFYARSPRFISLERAREIRAEIGSQALAAGVFVKPEREFVERMLHELNLDMLQIHGDESGDLLEGWPVPVLRPLSLRPGHAAAELTPRGGGFVLIDSYDPRLYGGTGRAIPVDDLCKLDLRRCFVAGGLTPESVKAVAELHPYGVDVASGVESAPGIKDHVKLRSFIENAKSAG
ncbi:MAG: phosphoribosylanthranilate isomerase [Candidatus Binataceae bacterium]